MNVIQALSVDTNKKYTWCEVSFLKRFWDDPEVTQVYKINLYALLKDGRMEVVGGGWVQHDETLTSYKM
jgi:hypothetical protein